MVEDYSYEIKCWNCGETNYWKIPKGIKVDEYEDTHNCNNCGCHVKLRKQKEVQNDNKNNL